MHKYQLWESSKSFYLYVVGRSSEQQRRGQEKRPRLWLLLVLLFSFFRHIVRLMRKVQRLADIPIIIIILLLSHRNQYSMKLKSPSPPTFTYHILATYLPSLVFSMATKRHPQSFNGDVLCMLLVVLLSPSTLPFTHPIRPSITSSRVWHPSTHYRFIKSETLWLSN